MAYGYATNMLRYKVEIIYCLLSCNDGVCQPDAATPPIPIVLILEHSWARLSCDILIATVKECSIFA